MTPAEIARSCAPSINRRAAIAGAAALVLTRGALGVASESSPAEEPHPRWYEAAAAMKRLAESWGDQPYGAVLVLNGALIGEGPSRVLKNQDITAHAERKAIRDAQRRLGRSELSGSVLYSTSRPCSLCETAAAEVGVRRMYFGAALTDAGTPRTATR
jgi:tRNA(Arg) A34 adenosine deaminase TadA